MLADPINNHINFAIFDKFTKKTSSGTGHNEIRRYKACLHKTVKQKSLNETSGTEFYYFFLNNQPDALIIQILFCYKTLHASGIFSAHHQEFSTVHSALVSFIQVSDDHFQADAKQFHPDSAWKRSSETCMKLTSAKCTVENS
jgi:hypothetical protein